MTITERPQSDAMKDGQHIIKGTSFAVLQVTRSS